MEKMDRLSNYFFVTYEKEKSDSEKLIKQITDSGWIKPETILVNCSPDYSSNLTQLINHKLSHKNKHELFEVVDLQMPYPTMSQVWNSTDKFYQPFEKYVLDWVRTQINSSQKYLFIDSGTLRGKNFTKVHQAIRGKIDRENFRFASLYLQAGSIFTPDFYAETFNKETQGGLLFQWENTQNPNWDY